MLTKVGLLRVGLVAALLCATACSGGGTIGPNNSSADPDNGSAAAKGSPVVPDACTVVAKADLERLVGRELRDGERKDVSPGLSQCDFATAPDSATTRRFPNPPLPEAAQFSSLTITTYPTSAESFANSRETARSASMSPREADEAYIDGGTVHARVADRGIGIRLHVGEPVTERGRQVLREVLLSLGAEGANRLR